MKVSRPVAFCTQGFQVGPQLLIAGQLPLDPAADLTLGNGDSVPEPRQTLRNFMAVLELVCCIAADFDVLILLVSPVTIVSLPCSRLPRACPARGMELLLGEGRGQSAIVGSPVTDVWPCHVLL